MPAQWRALARRFPKVYKHGVIVSWDNAKWHKPGNLLQIKGLPVRRLPLAALSHDLHKVVEHAINTHKATARKWFRDHPEVQNIDDIKREFERLWYEVVTAEAVAKDVATLHSTYLHVARSRARGGVAGDWPAKKYRWVSVMGA